ncbi:hypothetical protein ISN44_As03g022230 [Arabidopsis suecica]|uniref:Uncharacterized protein n=1 Tax=Arabidopsis suecica TaxID=45249 RepID=A0A8T2FDA5_ARASU|nr:hypothetical protein ISN44_As03g022230 [Arabidopsis suecica]
MVVASNWQVRASSPRSYLSHPGPIAIYLELRNFDHKKRINMSHHLLCLFH